MSGTVDVQAFRKACGQFLTGVTIVTAIAEDSALVGVTANSFTSVSLTPPLVLVCLDKKLGSYDSFVSAQGYAVHVLRAEHEHLSVNFATRGADKFRGLSYTHGLYQAPLLPDMLAVLECRTNQCIDAGDHAILLGEVERIHLSDHQGPPLGFLRGKYTTVSTCTVA